MSQIWGETAKDGVKMGMIYRPYAEKYRQLGRNLAYYRRLRGYSQAELAEKLELSEGYLGHIEAQNVDKEPSLQVLFRIAEALDVPVYKFFMDAKMPPVLRRNRNQKR